MPVERRNAAVGFLFFLLILASIGLALIVHSIWNIDTLSMFQAVVMCAMFYVMLRDHFKG